MGSSTCSRALSADILWQRDARLVSSADTSNLHLLMSLFPHPAQFSTISALFDVFSFSTTYGRFVEFVLYTMSAAVPFSPPPPPRRECSHAALEWAFFRCVRSYLSRQCSRFSVMVMLQALCHVVFMLLLALSHLYRAQKHPSPVYDSGLYWLFGEHISSAGLWVYDPRCYAQRHGAKNSPY
jgi:hypothetical protein